MTWFGSLRAGWRLARLLEVASTRVSNVDKHTIMGQKNVRLCNYVDVYYNDVITEDIAFMHATASDEQIARFRLRRNDTIITKDSETADDIGIPAFVAYEAEDLVCGYHLAIVRPDESRVVPKYLFWALRSDPTMGQWSTRATGVTRVGIKSSELSRITIALPPLDEQRAIADFLDRETAQIDTLIAKQQRLIATLRERRAAVVDRETSASGNAAPLRRAIESLRQGWSPVAESDSADGVTEWAVLKVGCTNSGTFDATQNKRLPAGEQPRPEHVVRRGEVVISRSNTRELVGAAAAVLEEYPKLMLSDLLYGVTPIRGVNAEFLAYALQSGPVRTQIRASAKGTSPSMQKISQADIRNLVVRIPPLAQQIDAAARIRKQIRAIDALIQKSERLIELSQERRAALITAAVTGRIDVRKAA